MLMQLTVDENLIHFKLPSAVHARLQHLLDRQDNGVLLTNDERKEAEGLVELAEFLSLLQLRAKRINQELPNSSE
ncbi:MAG TPA: hypothetical protein VLL52_14810 [Anaerolineae bacterium]|nr:hypothetical protein [Anaerolineae bacterium]